MTKILLVEDDKSLREIYGVRLLAEGYDIISAGDGEAALAMAIKERPSLIVSDVMMPKISGFDMLDILRSTTETKDIKVIMMTALSSEDQRARGEALGADRYLVKSQVGIEDVVRTVHEVLGDAPVAGASMQQTFGSAVGSRPAPAAAIPPRPAVAPQPPQTMAPAPAQTIPAAPSPFSAAPAPQPQVQPQQPSGLPQPTAPFSTARPASLGQRVIHPIAPQNNPTADISSLIAQELNQAQPPQPQMQQPAAPVPPRPVAPAPQPQPAIPPLPPPPPTPTVSVEPAPVQQPQVSQPESSGISFEETPRQMPPVGPQPPRQ